MIGITAIIITLNEELNIARCLTSLQGIADEIIVVDAESTDRTGSIAQGLGAKVIIRKWTDYSDQKNFANSQASHPYVLSLDADEELSEELRSQILHEKEQGLKGAYRFPRLTNYCGTWVKHGGWYPDRKIRLFPKSAARWAGDHVHEELQLHPDVKITDLTADLLHYSYHSLADHRERIERYSTLHARRMLAAGRKAGAVKLYLSPIAKFLSGYLLQLGFLDGGAGWHIARLSALAVHKKYKKLMALENA